MSNLFGALIASMIKKKQLYKRQFLKKMLKSIISKIAGYLAENAPKSRIDEVILLIFPLNVLLIVSLKAIYKEQQIIMLMKVNITQTR